ncbi:MAG TPA: cell division protein FtsQ/DivIB [Xanthobacteraceae bacterium]|nr:cell division protein FtsQ/DivIB [Xanthobacteraceae bacterium]HUC51946.1 cell division protein FtsQ/DivIB [Xanthobacteraceae bacterium]
MDGGGRLDQSLTRSGLRAGDGFGAPFDEPSLTHVQSHEYGSGAQDYSWPSHHRRLVARFADKIARLPLPRGFGVAATILIIAGALAYGAVRGQHVPAVVGWLKEARDVAANSLGFRIDAISLTGEKEVSREEILTTAGVTGNASLLFLDADAARVRLMADPWIADAAVLKLYPDRLQISITERRAFALWQKDGHVNVIAADGTVLEPYVEDRYLGLPLVVGDGAAHQAKDFLAFVDRYPDIRNLLRASVMVAGRRWNLRLTNGIDVKLPEANVGSALDRLVALDRDKKLLSRDITMIDLRLPDRVTVRLSDAAAAARDEVLKANTKKKKGGDA